MCSPWRKSFSTKNLVLLGLGFLAFAFILVVFCACSAPSANKIVQAKAAEKSLDFQRAIRLYSLVAADLEGKGQAGAMGDNGRLKNLATIYQTLGLLQFKLGQYVEAEPYFVRAIKTYGDKFGRDNDFVAACLNQLSRAYFNQGRFQQAELAAREANELAKSAASANNLAMIYDRLGEDKQARFYFERAIGLLEERAAKDVRSAKAADKELVDVLLNYALFFERRKDLEQARVYVEQALSLQDLSKIGSDANTVRSLLSLAEINRADYEYSAAENNFKRALNLLETKHKLYPDLYGKTLDRFADLLMVEHRYAEAEPLYKKAIESGKRNFGSQHPETAAYMIDLAVLLRRKGDISAAESLFREALAIQQRSLGEDSPLVLRTVNHLTAVLKDGNKIRDAAAVYENFMPALVAKLGWQHPYVADVLDNWALLAELSDDKPKAENLRGQARGIRAGLAKGTKR